MGWRNIRDLRLGLELAPHPRLRVKLDYHSFWLDSPYDNLYSSGGAVVVRPPEGGASSTHVGQETDITAVFSVSPYLSLGAGFGYLFPGSFLDENSSGIGPSFSYLYFTYQL